ncbi:MAG: response regulator, partial [Verrucomicrobia bacterium]|nr:response regulator [Verrucomicrobiota bacterium]
DLRMTLVRDEAGEPSGRLIIATDITDKRHLEEQFLRAQRLESLGLLAAGIAHDLNNVLAPVLMSAPILRLHVTAPSALRVLDILEKSAERGTGLVRQILGFSQGASTGLRLIQVKHLLRDLCAVVHASFPKSIALDDHVPADLWPVQGNPTQIHQVLLNLAINARDAMLPRGGTLRLAASNQTLDAAAAHAIEGARPGAFLVLEVGDTGTGIPPELLTRIWDPFFTTKGEGQGTGLGLATVRGIVASHHGFVTLTTRVDHGTTFRVFLPAEKPADPKGPAPADPELPRGHGELLLLVDDETDVRDIAGAILRDHGYRVLPACDGVDAIGLFTERATEIQLVITDVNMPHVDGHALASVLRRLRPELKIMAISGLGRTGNDSAAPFESAHFDTRLQKPFTVEDLLTTVHRTLHRELPAGGPA